MLIVTDLVFEKVSSEWQDENKQGQQFYNTILDKYQGQSVDGKLQVYVSNQVENCSRVLTETNEVMHRRKSDNFPFAK